MLYLSLLLFIVLATDMVFSDWIDIDTPADHYITYSFYDITNVLSTVHQVHENENENENSRRHRENKSSGRTSQNKQSGRVKQNKKRVFELVFSDEFNTVGRNFSNGQDSRWTSLDKDDYTNAALHYYDSEFVTTTRANHSAHSYSGERLGVGENGFLNITTARKEKVFSLKSKSNKNAKGSVTKHYGSGMLQSWNKFCFTGGIIEISAQLPGYYLTGGLWPALWLMGNLARATFVGSSENMWPWSSDICSRKNQKGQLLSACNRVNHYNLAAHQGTGLTD